MEIKKILKYIENQIGLKLQLDDYFTGVYTDYYGNEYFNVLVKDRLEYSSEFTKLKRFAHEYKTIEVEPNGLNRIAIIPLNIN